MKMEIDMRDTLTLISHALCPYVQRAAIVLAEKDVSFERITIDLADKPEWFKTASPLGKVPLLKVGDSRYLFESAPIVEFLNEAYGPEMHPGDPVERARHRAYIEFASQALNGIGALYNARDDAGFLAAATALRTRFVHLDEILDPAGPFFAGAFFCLVDAAFGPVFRYFDIFEDFADAGVLDGLDRVRNWRRQLAGRPSVRGAVCDSYPDLLRTFLRNRNSQMSHLLKLHEGRSGQVVA